MSGFSFGDADLKFVIDGAEFVDAHLNDLLTHMRPALGRTIADWSRESADYVATTPYPPPRPNQKYVRTYTLPTGFRATKEGRFSWAITNFVSYARWVVWEKSQAWMHEDRWWTVEGVMTPRLPQLTEKLRQQIFAKMKAWGGLR